MQKTISINLENIRILAIASAIGRSHLTRLVLIALELQHQGAEVAFAFKENSHILEYYQFQVFSVSYQFPKVVLQI